jgi:Sugar kinases, ribokinase family
MIALNYQNQPALLAPVSKSQNLRIIAMTVCCMDVYPQTKQAFVGGNSINFAAQCVKKGFIDTSVLGCVGTDAYGWTIIDILTKNKINVSHLYIHEGTTASNRIFISERGDRYFLPDSWDGGVYQSFILSDEDWFFVKKHDIVAIPANNPNFAAALERLGKSGKLVVDFLDSRDFNSIEAALPKSALGFISGNNDTVARLKALTEIIEAPIVVTLGAEGSVALHGGREFRQQAIPVSNIIDTTGCGDSYQAAFTVSWWKEHNLSNAMKEGSLAAAETLAHMGGI